MFEQKKTSLLTKREKPTPPASGGENAFVKAARHVSSETVSGNGAKKFASSGDNFLDQFATASNYLQPREYKDVAADMEKLWQEDALKCLKLTVYLRLITRETIVMTNLLKEGEEKKLHTQRGQGLKSEVYWRLMWLAVNQPIVFKANLLYFIAAGSWDDVFELMILDAEYNGWKDRKLDWEFLAKTILAGLDNPKTSDLVKKYLPPIYVPSKEKGLRGQARTMIGNFLANRFFGNSFDKNSPSYKGDVKKAYRQMKSSGRAHQWQKLISQGKLLEIDFNTVPGKALSQLVSSKFLKNHGLIDKYNEWIKNRQTAKYTGYVHDLFVQYEHQNRLPEYLRNTLNAQFMKLIETAKKDMNRKTRLLVVRDISSSMQEKAVGTQVKSFNVAKAFALYFSYLFEGPFSKYHAVFADKCELKEWRGVTPADKWENESGVCYGSTNFLRVADLLVRCKKDFNIAEADFPTGILCVSDGEFNSCSKPTQTNFRAFKQKLLSAGFSKEYVDNFQIILWDVPNGYYGRTKPSPKFETLYNEENFFYMSGFDPAGIAFLMGGKYQKKIPKTPEELMEAALNQQLLNMLFLPKVVREQLKRKR